MSILNNRLQLALLKRKRSGNALQKGFTLVELMIVIVIVGILSAVALPNFLNQTSKAKATECTTKFGSLLSSAGADALGDPAAAVTAAKALATDETNNSSLCTFTIDNLPSSGTVITGSVAGKGELSNEYAAKGCVNYATGKRDVNTGKTAAATTDAAC